MPRGAVRCPPRSRIPCDRVQASRAPAGPEQSRSTPRPFEIVPLLSCVLARRSILSIGGFSLAGGPDNQEIVRQHTESHLDPHTLQTPTTEPTQTPVGLGIRE